MKLSKTEADHSYSSIRFDSFHWGLKRFHLLLPRTRTHSRIKTKKLKYHSRNLSNRQVQRSVSFMSGKIFNYRRVNLIVKYLFHDSGHSSTSLTSACPVTKITFRFHLHQSHLKRDGRPNVTDNEVVYSFLLETQRNFFSAASCSDQIKRKGEIRERRARSFRTSFIKRAAERPSTCWKSSVYLQTTQTFEAPCHLRVDVDRRRDKLFRFP